MTAMNAPESPDKSLKSERTHEENQERAYIAASRRSDRSLEARVESACRASEIHKRRTGRGLRVTPQDVVNEEMYEEEEDDHLQPYMSFGNHAFPSTSTPAQATRMPSLPPTYRHLTAHLQTGSPQFDRRLSAFLSNQVAMRSALDQAITSSFAQQYPNAPQFAHNQTSFGVSTLPRAPDSSKKRSSIDASLSQNRVSHDNDRAHKKARAPSHIALPPRPRFAARGGSDDVGETSGNSSEINTSVSSSESLQPSRTSTATSASATGLNAGAGSFLNFDEFDPLTVALPLESQLLLEGGTAANDPQLAAMMPNVSQRRSVAMGDWSTHELAGQPQHYDSFIHGTHESFEEFSKSGHSAKSDVELGLGGEFAQWDEPTHVEYPSRTNIALETGKVTPGLDGAWDAYINASSWSEGVV